MSGSVVASARRLSSTRRRSRFLYSRCCALWRSVSIPALVARQGRFGSRVRGRYPSGGFGALDGRLARSAPVAVVYRAHRRARGALLPVGSCPSVGDCSGIAMAIAGLRVSLTVPACGRFALLRAARGLLFRRGVPSGFSPGGRARVSELAACPLRVFCHAVERALASRSS